MIYQLKTFQGVRYALFHYTTGSVPGGYTDFAGFSVDQPYPRGLTRAIPFGQCIGLETAGSVLVTDNGVLSAVPTAEPPASSGAAHFTVVDRGLGRVALQSEAGYVSVTAPGGTGQVLVRECEPTDAETFQWTETPYGDLILLSLLTHRHLRVAAGSGAVAADHPGPSTDRLDGSCFSWSILAG